MANTVIYNKHDYVTKLRERLARPTSWKDIMDVRYSDSRTIVNAILDTEPAVQSGTRGTAYSFQDFTLTADTLTISTYRELPIFIDEADRSQQAYFGGPDIAEFQGDKIDEFIESEVLAQHASWRNFGVGDLNNTSSNDASTITVTAANIDDLIRAVKRKIRANNGSKLARKYGYFFVWRAADLELLEGFMQANGFSEADVALKNGISDAFSYMGADHYLSNDHTANHLFAGVKKVGKTLGILRGTYGKVKFIEDPAGSTNNNLSGLGIHSRIDYGFSFPTGGPTGQNIIDMGVDVNVA